MQFMSTLMKFVVVFCMTQFGVHCSLYLVETIKTEFLSSPFIILSQLTKFCWRAVNDVLCLEIGDISVKSSIVITHF